MDVAKRTFMKRDENGNPVEAVSVPMSPFELQAWLAENAPGAPLLKQFLHAPPPHLAVPPPPTRKGGNVFRPIPGAYSADGPRCVMCSYPGSVSAEPGSVFYPMAAEYVSCDDAADVICAACFRSFYLMGFFHPERPNLNAHEGSEVHETEPTEIKVY